MNTVHSNQTRRWPRQPLLARLMQNAIACRLLALLLLVHFTLMQFDLSFWRCPIWIAVKVPCPGCGLSRSIVSLASGDAHQALARHAFGPIAAIGLSLLLIACLLPSRMREKLTATIEKVEITTGVSHLLLALSLLYWIARLLSGRGTIESLL